MATLDKWRPFLTTPKAVAFPRLELIGRDSEPAIVVGSGDFRMPSPTRFEYTLTGLPADVNHALRAIARQQQNPYDGLARFRLIGTDDEGVEWSLGWTIPSVEPGNEVWTFVGETDCAWPRDDGEGVAKESSTELVFLVPVDHPMALAMGRFVWTDQPDGRPKREHVMEVVGSTIKFAYDPTSGALSIAAMHSPRLPPTYTENWLAEPLRVLFGQLVFPRLVARNLGNGRTHVSVRRAPGLISGAGWAALWSGDDPGMAKESFWARYADLLTLIAHATGPDGRPNFEAHQITKLYEEIIQAASGTRWVWALTFASCIEGIANLIEPPGRKRRDTDEKAVHALVDHISAWSGDGRLKQNAINAVHRAARTTTVLSLRRLVAAGAIGEAQLDAWEDIRHAVMHGSLVSPYSSAEDDGKLLSLSSMMHALTLELLRRSCARASSMTQDDDPTESRTAN